MAERERFELDLAAALRAYAEDAPTRAWPTELARQFAAAHPHGRTRFGPWRLGAIPRLAWVLLLAVGLLAALVGGMLIAGSQPERKLPAVVPPVASPTANPDVALVADLAALFSAPYDAARVAALYAPNAVIHELTDANLTYTGLEKIGVRIRYLNTQDFKVVVTSAPIRQDDFVASFVRFGGGEATYPGLVVYELKDGKVLNQWVYPAP